MLQQTLMYILRNVLLDRETTNPLALRPTAIVLIRYVFMRAIVLKWVNRSSEITYSDSEMEEHHSTRQSQGRISHRPWLPIRNISSYQRIVEASDLIQILDPDHQKPEFQAKATLPYEPCIVKDEFWCML